MVRPLSPLLYLALLLAMSALGCPEPTDDDDATADDDAGDDDAADDDAADDDSGDDDSGDDDTTPEDPCEFNYDEMFPPGPVPPRSPLMPRPYTGPGVAHAEPLPPSTWVDEERGGLVMPSYTDDMPPFERSLAWVEEERCFSLPHKDTWLTEDEAYDLYRDIAELTTGVAFSEEAGARSVVGMRGAYPGTFSWHGNTPDRFNDALILLWVDGGGAKHVREFAAHTDVGDRDFGYESSSSLRPNRRYFHSNGWHSGYNALSIAEWGYRVRDDTNNNGHWDSDRNGWLPPLGENDYDRGGSGHNIHLASVDAPLGEAEVGVWSAGCQTIPGIVNWTEFIQNAWTESGDYVQYFLVDARDIAPEVWGPCTPDGSHDCPYPIGVDDQVTGDTATSPTDEFDVYNCSDADESGPEEVYVFTLDETGTLHVEVDCDDPAVDIDIHLLDGDDPDACLARGHWDLDYDITEGRYFIVADTYVDGGDELSGEYTLTVELL